MSSEPSAWGVLRVGGGWVSILANEVQAETSRQSFDKTENWVHEAVPLDRLPTLTDEEREAVEGMAAYFDTRGNITLQAWGSLLRVLLARLSPPAT